MTNALKSVSNDQLTDQMIVRECLRVFHERLGTIKARYSEKFETRYPPRTRTIALKFGLGVRYFSLDSFSDGGALSKRFSELIELIEADCPQDPHYRILQLVTHPLPCEGNAQRCLFDGVSLRISSRQDASFDEIFIDVCYTFEPLIG